MSLIASHDLCSVIMDCIIISARFINKYLQYIVLCILIQYNLQAGGSGVLIARGVWSYSAIFSALTLVRKIFYNT
jgi:hypothetical protein